MKKILSLVTFLTVFTSQALATSVIGKMSSGSDGLVLLIPTTYLYIGTAPGYERLPWVGCVKVDGTLKYEYIGNGEQFGQFTAIHSVEILKDAECEGIQ